MQQPPPQQWGPNPYQPPGGFGAPPQPGGYAPQPLPGSPFDYTPLGWRTALASISIGTSAVAQFLVAAMLPVIASTGQNVGIAAIVALLSVVSGIALIAAAVFFFIWTYAAASNARGLGNELLQISPGWTIGWWFIPFANLVMPFRAIKEIWQSSDPDARRESSTEWTLRKTSPFVTLWWATYLLASIVSSITLVFKTNGVPTTASYILPLVAMTARVGAALFIILVMTGTNRRQQAQAMMLGAVPR